MGKIADAFERRDRENLLKIDTRLREQPIRLPQGKLKATCDHRASFGWRELTEN